MEYGRNEKLMFCVFTGHERQKLFWGNHYFHWESPYIKFSCCDFLAGFLTKGLFLTSATQMLPTLMAEIAVLMVFDIRMVRCTHHV